MTPLFWQYLAAAELSSAKAQEFLRTLGPSHDPISALMAHPFIDDRRRSKLEGLDLRRFDRVMAAGVQIAQADSFPSSLEGLQGLPPSLYFWGDAGVLEGPCISIVGTRTASSYGRAVARKFAQAFASAGVTVISGGALGIDEETHEGALEAGGKTAAVLGHGIDHVFPASHAPLFERIRSSGCLVSQFAIGKPSLRENFPLRNQLIAALSQAVLVVEAPQKSGSLITTSYAAELGREVFVVPGNITMESFRGSHALLRDGASLVDHPDQILESLGIDATPAAIRPDHAFAGAQAEIINAIGADCLKAEQISARTGLSSQDVMSELTMLEIEGAIIRGDGGYSLKP